MFEGPCLPRLVGTELGAFSADFPCFVELPLCHCQTIGWPAHQAQQLGTKYITYITSSPVSGTLHASESSHATRDLLVSLGVIALHRAVAAPAFNWLVVDTNSGRAAERQGGGAPVATNNMPPLPGWLPDLLACLDPSLPS